MKKKLLSFLSLTAIAIIAFAATQISRRAVGTEIWSADPAEALVWDQPNITIPAEKFADVKVGDIVHINMTDVKTGATNPWDAQVSFRSTNWKNLDKNQDIAGVGTADPITDAQYVLTGDMVKILKATGAQINGTGAKVSSVTLESVAAATGTDKSIWIGSVTKDNVTINNCHFANFDNFNGVKKGDIIRVYLEKTDSEQDNWIGLYYYKGWTWTEFTADDIETKNDYTNPVVDFIIKSDAAVTEINDAANNNGVVVANPKQTVKQVELIRMYAVNIADGITNGKVEVDKTTAEEGDEVTITATPAEGYKLASLSVRGVTTDLVVTVTDNKFTMPADAVTVSATFVQPEDITINPASGADIYTELKAATTDVGKVAKNITINLAENGAYTISKSIEAGANVTINGAAGATIDASALTTPFILMSKTPAVDGVDVSGVTAYPIDGVSIKNVSITGLNAQLFYANKTQYLLSKLSVENAIIGMSAAKTIFDFNSGGNVVELSVDKSTLYGPNTGWSNGGFHSTQTSKSVPQLGGTTEKTIITNSTLYNISYTKTTSTIVKNSQDWMSYVVKNNVIVNSGKSGQFLKGLNNGQPGKDTNWDVDGNIFNFDGANVVETCGASEGIVKNSVAGRVVFTDAANGDFNYNFAAAPGSTVPASIGDPRWTKTDVATYAITVVQADGMTLTPEKNYAVEGEKVYGTFTIEDGYEPEMPEFTDTDTGDPIAFVPGVDFNMEEVGGVQKVWVKMPAKNLTITLKTAKVSKINLDLSQEHGQATCISVNAEDPTTYYKKQGKEIYLNVVPDADYEAVISVICADETVVDVIAETGTYSGQAYTHKFIMPAQDVTAKVTFRVATGINGISVDGAAADIFSDGKPVYNLSGQRVFKGYKGIVIKEGKKIVVK